MNQQARFVKTEKGHDEIKNRTHKLEARTRQLLVMVDGGKSAADLLQTAKGFGGSTELLLSLLNNGFIQESGKDDSGADDMREKVFAAKAAMRRYIKMAQVDVKTLSQRVDEIKEPADVNPVLREMKRTFEANGFAEAFANLSKEVAAL